ncbi:MAG: hypothetical protein AAGA76_13865 [Pseudomonadota bacterium]
MANHFRISPNLVMGVENFSSKLKRLTINHSKKVEAWIARKKSKQEDRSALRKLLQSTDRELLDIGITRGAVIWASKLPDDRLGTKELQKIAQSRHSSNLSSKGKDK